MRGVEDLANAGFEEMHVQDEIDELLRLKLCLVCKGTGRNPMSDNVNWLPCSTCNGTGKGK